jgi:pyridoxal phosphate-dependent aminotransferase EpsN
MGGAEQSYVREAFASNWLSTAGPNITAFEREFEEYIGLPSLALGSGTSAIHLGLRALGVKAGDRVFCSTLTFAASANPIRYQGAEPVFIDSNTGTWNMDPELLRKALRESAEAGQLPKAVVVVDLYGQCADMDPIRAACDEYGVPILEDAAEALGAVYWGDGSDGVGKGDSPVCPQGTHKAVPLTSGTHMAAPLTRGTHKAAPLASELDQGVQRRPGGLPHNGLPNNSRRAGTFGDVTAFSFNGNKIITTTGGGMLVSKNREWVDKARFWSTQAKDQAPWYEHSEIGYNYRMSNVLAGIGRGQLQVLELRVQQRRANAFRYRDAFADVPGIALMPQAAYGLHTNWLSCFLIEQEKFGCSRDELIQALNEADIESRPVWKPMHLQPVYAGCECYGGEVAADLFGRGICLPSSSSLTLEDQLRVVNAVRKAAHAAAVEELEGSEPATLAR